MSKQRLHIIGHSHAVTLLDGISNWRETVSWQSEAQDHRYSEAFQGWFTNTLPTDAFELKPHRDYPEFADAKVCLITGAKKVENLVEISSKNNGDTVLNVSSFLEQFSKKVSDDGVILSVLFGSEHSVHTLINGPTHQPPYDFMDEGDEELHEEAIQPIDTLFIDRVISLWILKITCTLMGIRYFSQRPILHILPPPPLEDPTKSDVKEIFQQSILTYGFLNPKLRLKWYRRYCRLLTETLQKSGIFVVAPPVEVVTSDGFLAPQYSEGLSHGNTAYGTALAGNVISLLGDLS